MLNLFTLIILIMVLVSIGSIMNQSQSFKMPESGALRIAINGGLVDQRTYVDPIEMLLNPDMPQEVLVHDLVAAIDMAAQDERINSMTLVLGGLEYAGISKIEEVGQAILRFRETGKPVIAYADLYDQQKYLLASYADRVLMHPMGAVELLGLASYQPYMEEALKKLKVKVHVFQTGPHKSAAEPLVASKMSDENREQIQWLLEDLWLEYQTSLMSRRDISQEQITNYSHNIDHIMLESGMSLGEIALANNLVDALVTRDQLIAEIQAIAGHNEEGDFYSHTNVLPYLYQNAQPALPEQPRIGYLVAKGAISDGTQQSGAIGGDSLAWQLKQARLNDDLKALVMRVDSPGGSAFASEVIRRELELYDKAGIPVVVSMGSVAASGGYWISMPADEIWATPSTITGSIGAVALIPIIDKSLNAIGLNTDGVETGPLASAFRLDRPLSDKAKTIFRSQIDYLYNDFLNMVADARDMPMEQLEPIAGGRVWTGNQALENGLIDHIGGHLDAIASAARLAGVQNNYQVFRVEPKLTFAEELAKSLLEQISLNIDLSGYSWLNKLLKISQLGEIETGSLMADPRHMYLHCEHCNLGHL